MNALDTNVVVRCLINDNREQADKARSLVTDGSVFISTTVVLETEWVLRRLYQMSRKEIAAGLMAFAGLPTVVLEDPRRVNSALDATARGLDFADALHLAAADGCDAFYTFDRGLAKMASRVDGIAVRTP